MKKLILVFAALAITAGTYAQMGSIQTSINPPDMNKSENQNLLNKPIDDSHPDGVMMKNGKMLMFENGKKTNMDNEVTMSNGTKVTSDGTYIKEDGIKRMLKEGEHIDMDGNITSRKTNKDDKMHLEPDSTRHEGY